MEISCSSSITLSSCSPLSLYNFQIPSLKLHTVPPCGYNTMTSVPVCKKTSFSQKLSVIEAKLVLNTNRKSSLEFIWNTTCKSSSLFQNPSGNTIDSAPLMKNDVIPGLQERTEPDWDKVTVVWTLIGSRNHPFRIPTNLRPLHKLKNPR